MAGTSPCRITLPAFLCFLLPERVCVCFVNHMDDWDGQDGMDRRAGMVTFVAWYIRTGLSSFIPSSFTHALHIAARFCASSRVISLCAVPSQTLLLRLPTLLSHLCTCYLPRHAGVVVCLPTRRRRMPQSVALPMVPRTPIPDMPWLPAIPQDGTFAQTHLHFPSSWAHGDTLLYLPSPYTFPMTHAFLFSKNFCVCDIRSLCSCLAGQQQQRNWWRDCFLNTPFPKPPCLPGSGCQFAGHVPCHHCSITTVVDMCQNHSMASCANFLLSTSHLNMAFW